MGANETDRIWTAEKGPSAAMNTRRLAAIVVADLVGSSRLIQLDERGTLAAIDALQKEIIAPLARRHCGRVVKTTGDGAILEFASPVGAVECAVDVQEAVQERWGGMPEDGRIRLRIGVNLGDIVATEDDVYGDGVNVAARLEGIASPGGVWISGKVFDELQGKLAIPFKDLGEQQLKNIPRRVRVYGWTRNGPAQDPEIGLSVNLPHRPSVAVLPFTNLSADPEQEYFVDGITQDIITALSRVKWLFVIARNSSFVFKGRATDVSEVGRTFGVRYVLQGSVRKAGNRLRITGQLINAATGNHVWADRYDRDLSDVFELQDEITQQVVASIEPSLRALEIDRARAKPTESLDAYDLYLRALPQLNVSSAESFRGAEALLRKAIEQDPAFGDALATLSECVARQTLNGWLEDHKAGGREACELARRAMQAEPENGVTLATAAYCLAILCGDHEEVLEIADRALRLHPNSVHVRTHLGYAYYFCGECEKAIAHVEVARRLSPLDPRAYVMHTALAGAHFFNRNFEQTVYWARRVLQEAPSNNTARRYLAAALAHLGRHHEAERVVADLLRSQPNSSLTRSLMNKFRYPWMLELYLDGLRKAGLPE